MRAYAHAHQGRLQLLLWRASQTSDVQVAYKRYASLYFVMGIDASENELITLEVIHHFVEVLDKYFGNVCELDLIFNFHKVRPYPCDTVQLLQC